MVTARILGYTAVIEDYVWRCEENPALAEALNALLPDDGPSGADPNPDLTAAHEAVERYGGEILAAERAEYEDGRIY